MESSAADIDSTKHIDGSGSNVLVSLPDPPTDGITGLAFIGESDLLVSTSWDGCIRIHDTDMASHKATKSTDSGPLLSLTCTSSSKEVVVGGLNGNILLYDITTHSHRRCGRHLGNGRDNKIACSCLASIPQQHELIASAGWDGRFHLWDVRANENSRAAATVILPAKAYSMDSHANTVVIATANRRICVLDLRNTSQFLVQDRESSLKYQTRTLRLFPDGTGFALGSIEGRVAIEYLDEEENKKKYAFKCHRVGDTVYPVNAIEFHPVYGTFATGGADGTVVLWDAWNKKRLTTLPKFASTSISALAFNLQGTKLACASSYTFEEGEREHPRDEIFVRKMHPDECKPKTKK